MAVVSYILYLLVGLYLVVYYLIKLHDWWGWFGVIGGVIFAPAITLFPFIFWFIEGYFPWVLFSVWVVGVLAMLSAGFATDDDVGQQNTGKKIFKWSVWVIIVLVILNTASSLLFTQTCTLIDENTQECSYVILRSLPDEREVFDEENNTVTTYNKDTGEVLNVRTLGR